MVSKYIIGAIGAIAALSTGLFIWQTNANAPLVIPNEAPPEIEVSETLPEADSNAPQFGPEPPSAPKAAKASKEERRFNRYDLDRNEEISRIEMMASRTKAFKKLDVDGNNLLTFEEWAVRTGDKFSKADKDKNLKLSRSEFRTTRGKSSKKKKPKCKC